MAHTICFALLLVGASAENTLTKLWSVRGLGPNVGRTAVLNVTSATLVKTPASNEGPRYLFKPRAIPLQAAEPRSQMERSNYYVNSEHKSDILLPGNYFPIADVKRQDEEEEPFNPLEGGEFQPKPIPLLRQRSLKEHRSLDDEADATEVEYQPSAQRRSISYFVDDDDDEELKEEDDDDDDDDDDLGQEKKGNRRKRKGTRLKRKYVRYMLPLLLAYKLKFFTLIPVLIAGLILIVKSTGMAGFFFALFAAAMGLQKGGSY